MCFSSLKIEKTKKMVPKEFRHLFFADEERGERQRRDEKKKKKTVRSQKKRSFSISAIGNPMATDRMMDTFSQNRPAL